MEKIERFPNANSAEKAKQYMIALGLLDAEVYPVHDAKDLLHRVHHYEVGTPDEVYYRSDGSIY